MRTLILMFAVLALTLSCKKKKSECTLKPKPTEQAQLIFGSGYGECGGNCVHYYKIKDGQLYTDSIDNLAQPIAFLVTPLSNTKYNLALPLLNDFPAALKNNTDSIIGWPDSRDQGLYHFEYTDNGLTKKWIIDPDSIPANIKTYMIRVDSVLAGLAKP